MLYEVITLALGAAIGLVAVVARQELVLLIMGGVFVVETVSVIIQVASYKLTGLVVVFFNGNGDAAYAARNNFV